MPRPNTESNSRRRTAVGVEQERRVGGHCAALVRGDLLVDDRADALLLLGARRQQSPVAQRAAHRLDDALANQTLGRAIHAVWRLRSPADRSRATTTPLPTATPRRGWRRCRCRGSARRGWRRRPGHRAGATTPRAAGPRTGQPQLRAVVHPFGQLQQRAAGAAAGVVETGGRCSAIARCAAP